MLSRSATVTVLIITVVLFSGCSQTMLEKNWGSSFESAKSSQTANPEAEENLNPVVGLDGQLAEKSMETYRKAEGEQQSTTYDLNLGTIAGIGTK